MKTVSNHLIDALIDVQMEVGVLKFQREELIKAVESLVKCAEQKETPQGLQYFKRLIARCNETNNRGGEQNGKISGDNPGEEND